MAIETAPPPPQHQPLPVVDHRRPIAPPPRQPGFEQVRQQANQVQAPPPAAIHHTTTGPGVARPAGRAGAPAVPPAGQDAAAAAPRTAAFVPPLQSLGHVRDQLQQAVGRTHLAQQTSPAAAASAVARLPVAPAPAPRSLAAAPAALPRVATPVPVRPLAEQEPVIAQATEQAQLQAAVQERTARTEGAPGAAPHQRTLIDQLI